MVYYDAKFDQKIAKKQSTDNYYNSVMSVLYNLIPKYMFEEILCIIHMYMNTILRTSKVHNTYKGESIQLFLAYVASINMLSQRVSSPVSIVYVSIIAYEPI